MANRLGFDNARHPAYQSAAIDKSEAEYRQNDRLVYQASDAEVAWLSSRIVPHVLSNITLPHGDGTASRWRAWGLNDMWRFYRYDDEKTAFPPHHDNSTGKTRSLHSFMSVLVYLSEDFAGGQTVFYKPDHASQRQTPCFSIKPATGTAMLFGHIGICNLHSGNAYQGGREPKYVLRTDVLYECVDDEAPTFGGFRLSTPYRESGYTWPHARALELVRTCGRAGGADADAVEALAARAAQQWMSAGMTSTAVVKMLHLTLLSEARLRELALHVS